MSGSAGFDITRYSSMLDVPRRVAEPYFWVSHIPFAFFLVDILRPRLLVELGVHSGNSYNAFCQAVDHFGMTATCYGVDTWQGDETAGHYDESVYHELTRYQQDRYRGFSHLLRMPFEEAREYFSDSSIDLLHIDGLHTYESVRHDFETWLPKMSERGIVLLHDTQVREMKFGVWRLWEEISSKYPSLEFTHGHGLGVLAVGEEVLPEFLQFLGAARHEAFYRRLFSWLGSHIQFLAEASATDGCREDALKELIEEAKRRERVLDEREQAALETERATLVREQYVRNIEISNEEKDTRIEKLGEEAHAAESERAARESELRDRDVRLGQLERELEERDIQIKNLLTNLELASRSGAAPGASQESESSSAVIRRQADRMEHLERELEGYEACRTELQRTEHLERELEGYEACRTELQRIKSSQGWEFLLRYYRLRDRLLPEGSWRRRVVKSMVDRVTTHQRRA